MNLSDQARTPLDGIDTADILVELNLLLHKTADDEWNALLRTAAQASVAAIRKLQDLAPLMEDLFQAFAGDCSEQDLHNAISAVWKEWAR